MNDKDIIRRLMHEADDDMDKKSIKQKLNEIKITSTPKTLVIENNGRRYQVPTLLMFTALLKECQTQRNTLRDAQVIIKKLTETVKKLDISLKNVENELTTKADKYDNT